MSPLSDLQLLPYQLHSDNVIRIIENYTIYEHYKIKGFSYANYIKTAQAFD
jgi:hypothetical protein